MITTGTKSYLTIGIGGLLAAILYGIITNGALTGGVVHTLTGPGAVNAVLGPLTFGYKGGVGDVLGYTVLMAFALCNIGLGVTHSLFRDADAIALAQLDGVDALPAVRPRPALNIWPLVMAVGVVLVVIGLVTTPWWLAAGVVVMLVAGSEWLITSWSEAATGDAAVNKLIRGRLLGPLELPVAAFLGFLFVVFCVSRLLLMLAGTGAIVAASVLAAVVFVGAIFLSSRPQLRRPAMVALLVVAVLAVLAMGIIGAVVGPKEHNAEHSAARIVPSLTGDQA
jgi:hypothetical protein